MRCRLIYQLVQEIAAVLNHPRVYAFLHIPVQSGSDAVLRDMKREYSSHHFRMIMDFMLKKWVLSLFVLFLRDYMALRISERK